MLLNVYVPWDTSVLYEQVNLLLSNIGMIFNWALRGFFALVVVFAIVMVVKRVTAR